MDQCYLKSTIKVKPLMWQCCVWPYLIPPLSTCCNIVKCHLKIMHSYVQNPQIHAQAIKDPKSLGGPFFNLDGNKVDEVKEQVNQIKKGYKKFVTLNNCLKEPDLMLQFETKGESLDPLYNRIPILLKELVELLYVLNNHPFIRLIELLIYKKYCTAQHQNPVREYNVRHRKKS